MPCPLTLLGHTEEFSLSTNTGITHTNKQKINDLQGHRPLCPCRKKSENLEEADESKASTCNWDGRRPSFICSYWKDLSSTCYTKFLERLQVYETKLLRWRIPLLVSTNVSLVLRKLLIVTTTF